MHRRDVHGVVGQRAVNRQAGDDEGDRIRVRIRAGQRDRRRHVLRRREGLRVRERDLVAIERVDLADRVAVVAWPAKHVAEAVGDRAAVGQVEPEAPFPAPVEAVAV